MVNDPSYTSICFYRAPSDTVLLTGQAQALTMTIAMAETAV